MIYVFYAVYAAFGLIAVNYLFRRKAVTVDGQVFDVPELSFEDGVSEAAFEVCHFPSLSNPYYHLERERVLPIEGRRHVVHEEWTLIVKFTINGKEKVRPIRYYSKPDYKEGESLKITYRPGLFAGIFSIGANKG